MILCGLKKLHPRKILPVLAIVLFAFAFTVTALPKKAEASGCCSCTASVAPVLAWEWGDPLNGSVAVVLNHIIAEFTVHRIWYAQIFWEDNILPALMLMSEQITAIAMQQIMVIGQFIDAQHQIETMQVFQEMQAQIHKDYQPSDGVCEVGTAVKSLAASDRRVDFNAVVLSQRAQDRNLGNAYSAAAQGQGMDKESRLAQFRTDFCHIRDNNDGLAYVCDTDADGDNNPATGAAPGATDARRLNKDIDYVRAVEYPWTLDVDFTDTTLTDNEEEIMALASNLYGHEVLNRPPAVTLAPERGKDISDMQKVYMDMRALVAKRSVAENSFNAITALKSEGTAGSRDFLIAVLEELGVPNAWPIPAATPPNLTTEAEALLTSGNTTTTQLAPSYHAQMEILTKKIFQDPQFYTNLYDTPANVTRKGVALQAIGLMQKFDLFKSYLRREASVAVLLEMAVKDLQVEVENDINQLDATGALGR